MPAQVKLRQHTIVTIMVRIKRGNPVHLLVVVVRLMVSPAAFVSARVGRGAVQTVATIGRGALMAVTRMSTVISPIASRTVQETAATSEAVVS